MPQVRGTHTHEEGDFGYLIRMTLGGDPNTTGTRSSLAGFSAAQD